MDFLIATHNPGKREEMQRMLEHLGIRVLLASEAGVTLSEPEENGKTFEENAMIKAKAGVADSGLPCIADDSGLVVDALDGRPGIYTARYGGEEMPYPEKIQMLVREMASVPAEKRTARFVSCIACAFPDGRNCLARGECEGTIGFTPYGKGGFGFDPIFYVGQDSFASLSPEAKDAISHRGNAIRKFALLLPSFLKGESE